MSLIDALVSSFFLAVFHYFILSAVFKKGQSVTAAYAHAVCVVLSFLIDCLLNGHCNVSCCKLYEFSAYFN